MALHPTKRTIGQSSAECAVCDWKWIPRPSTTTTGQAGYRNAVMAARGHGDSARHEVTVARTTHYAPEAR